MLTGEKWLMTDEEIGWYKKFNVPPSKCSPRTRRLIGAAFTSAAQYWNHRDALSGKSLISAIHPSSGVKVVSDESWHASDFSTITREDDASKSVLEIIRSLELEVPFMALRNPVPPINSIATISMGDENSFFVLASRSKNTLFGINAIDVENSMEILQCHHVSDSYNLSNCQRIHNGFFLSEAYDCINAMFLFDCRNCENCFMSCNQRNKRFVFKNQQLSEEDYRARMATIDLRCRSTVDALKAEFYTMMRTQAIWSENFNEKTENSTGEYLSNVTNCHECYNNASGSKDNYYCTHSFDQSEGNAFCMGLFTATNNYYSIVTSRSSETRFSYLSVQSQNLEYSMHCYNCENCFGCIGLNRKKFCIFNKQYTEDAYWLKLDELKCRMLDRGEYGEFFPVSFAPVYFLDSGAAQYFLADEVLAKQLNARLYEPESNGACGDAVDVATMRQLSDIPDCIDAMVPTEWVGKAIYDKNMRRRFTFLPQEIAFYEKHKIAAPAKHFIGRIQDLGWRLNSGQMISAACAQCGKALSVGRNKFFGERKIYCREDYLKFLETNG